MRTQVNTSPCVRESRFWNPRNFCPWNLGYWKFYLRNPKSWALESEIQLKVSWIPPTMGHFRVPPTLTFKMRLGAQPFLWKWVLFAWEWKMISISKAEHLPSFWNRGLGELWNGLLESGIQVPLTKNPESSTWNLQSMAWNPESKTVLDSLTWRENHYL